MKHLSEYIIESQRELYHFTHSDNLINIIKNDEWVGSSDDGINFYISTTRTKNAEIGYPTQMWISKNVLRVVFNGRLFNSRYKITPIDKMGGKKMAIRANWPDPQIFDQNKDEIMKQGNVESEDRVLIKGESIKQVHKYINAIHINMENIDSDHIEIISKYCDKYGILLVKFPTTKKFNLGR